MRKVYIFMFIVIALTLIQCTVAVNAVTSSNNTTIIICYSPYEELIGRHITFNTFGYGEYNGVVIDAIGSYLKTNASNKYINIDKLIGAFEIV